jgi:hypothetical protein
VILYEDGLLKLDYDVGADILYLPCPDIYEHELEYLPKIFSVVVEVLNNYSIKKMLFDTSHSQLHVTPREYQHLLRNLTYGLTGTQLQKLARVVSLNAARENGMTQFLDNATIHTHLPYIIQNFNNRATAELWLQAGN